MALLAEGAADLVVHNDLARREPGGAFPAEVWRPDGSVAAYCADRAVLAAALEKLIVEDPARAEDHTASAGAAR